MSLRLDRLAVQLDWNLLRTFMVIVQERSITNAAARLNVTQPSVSAALRRLEERLELRLVERGAGQSFVITRAGEAVYREALEIYGGVVRLNNIDANTGLALSGNLVIHRSSHLETDWIMASLADFRRQHPGVTFSLRSVSCAEVTQALLHRVSAIGFCTRVDPTIQRLEAMALTPQEFGAFCGPAHPLYRQQIVDPAVLAETDVVGFEEDQIAGALSRLTRFRMRLGIGARVIAAASGIVDLVELIESGTAIGLISRGHAARYGFRLWQIPLDVPPPVVEVYSLVDSERLMSPLEVALLEHLEAEGIARRPQRRSAV